MTRAFGSFVIAGVLVAPAVFASPGARSGFGSRAQALAGADVADARGPAAVFHNPAALVQTLDTELSLGASTTSYDLSLDGRDAGLTSVPAFDFGVVVPGSVLTIPVAFGLDLSLPDGRFSKLHNADPGLPYYPLDDSGPRLLDLGMALAIRPVAWLAIGGGVGFLAAAQGGFHATGTAVVANGSGTEYASELRHSVDADLVSVRYPIFGATVRPSRTLTLGLAFRGSATIEQHVRGVLEGDARFVTGAGNTDIPVRYAFETRARLAFLPAVLAVGAASTPIEGWRFGLQLDWEGWSAYPSPFARPDRKLESDPPPGFPIPIELSPSPRLPELDPFSDRLVPRVGIEKTFELTRSIELAARLGYAYQAAVVPERQGRSRRAERLGDAVQPPRQDEAPFVDFDRHVVALGAGGLFERPFGPFAELRLDAHASLAAGVARTITTGPESAPVDHRASGRLVGAGATLSVAFDALGRTEDLY